MSHEQTWRKNLSFPQLLLTRRLPTQQWKPVREMGWVKIASTPWITCNHIRTHRDAWAELTWENELEMRCFVSLVLSACFARTDRELTFVIVKKTYKTAISLYYCYRFFPFIAFSCTIIYNPISSELFAFPEPASLPREAWRNQCIRNNQVNWGVVDICV